ETARALVVTLSVAQTQALLSEVPRAYHTQINDVLLTALVQAFARWTGQSCLLVHLEGHGREDLFEDVDLSRTVGWFTSLIPLVLKLKEGEGPGERLKSIKEQLRAVPQGGISFGLLRYLCQDAAIREHLAALPQPQVAFNYAGRVGSALTPEGLFAPAAESAGVLHSLKGRRPHVLEINGGILDGQLYVQWSYSETLHRHATIEKLAQGYLEALQELIEHCQSPQAGGFTPSDFPQARLSQSALDALLAVLRETGDETRAGSARIEAIYPLSPLQEGMLFHRLYAPESEVYFEQVGYGVRGSLDGKAWRGAWEQVVQQHAILRTLFVWEHLERPLQVMRSQVRVPSEEHDWRAYSPEEQAERLEQWKRADRARGFVLGQAPLLRVALHRLSDEWGYVSWSFHHLLLDGWSVATVVGEVFACYQALRQGSRRRLPTRRSYGDYLIWLQQQDLAQAEGYWRERLRGFGAPTPLGVDRPGHSLHGTDDDYHHQHIQLSVAMTARLQTLAREQQVTLNTLVQGAWALLLARYSGQDDVVFGVTVSGRPAGLAGVEEMVGLFINTLPVRVQVYAEQRLIPWLQQLQQQQAEARQYEYSPLTQVQGWSEVPRGQPLFESLLVFENYPIDVSTARIQESQLTIEHVEAVERTNYPLTITVVPHAGTRIRISYMGKRFTHEAIRRMLGHFQALLEGMMAYPERRLADLPMLTAEERQQLLFEWNAASPVAAQERCLSQIFEQQAALLTDAVAVVYEEEQLTYGELNIKANCVAWYLRHLGVGPEVLVGLCLERSVAMIVAILGILKAGGAYLPLDPASPPERLAFVLHDARASVLLSEQSLLPRLPAVSIPLLCLDRDWATIASVPPAPVPLRQHADQLAYVIYTSGSTGTPKGVLVPHRQVTRLFASTQSQFRFGPQDHWTLFHSIAFDFSVWELWGALLFGGRLTVVPWWQSREPESFWHLLAMQQISVLNLTPSAFRQLVTIIATASVKPALALRLVIFGGEALDLSSVRSWWSYVGEHGPHLVNMYGITETTVHVTACPLSREVMSEGQASPIGRPLPDLQVYVLDGRGQPVPVGVVGELYVGGAGVTRGYLGRPELTAQRFVPHPWSREPGARLYRSGDLARYTQEGQLEYLGRNDAQVKLRGFRIELGEIEAVLQEHPSVREAVVMLREDDPGDARLVAYVVTSQQHPTTSSELRRHLQQRLPDYMVPSSLVLLEALPLTSNGKVDREALPQPGQIQVEHKSAYVAPRTRMEEELASIWEQVLQRESIGVYDHFLELGGDSLLATQIIARIRHAFQVDLSPRNLLRTATIATLAEQIEAAQRERQTTRIPSIKRLARPLS
ncbi:MAG TPA: amino acid adenylation domain-containing protein, partial [Ktedonobacteraceae bacterium]|nr:amino acid adenylation domain-containing protein [Ktedonobacteraceae bacterium]